MQDFTNDELLAFLNRAWNNAGQGANSLPDQLITEQQAALAYLAPVGSLSHLSKNSTAQGYGGYNPGNLTLRQIVNIWTRLTEIYADVKSQITNAFSQASIVIPGDYDFDNDTYVLMQKFIRASDSAIRQPDIRDMRIPLSRTYEVSYCP